MKLVRIVTGADGVLELLERIAADRHASVIRREVARDDMRRRVREWVRSEVAATTEIGCRIDLLGLSEIRISTIQVLCLGSLRMTAVALSLVVHDVAPEPDERAILVCEVQRHRCRLEPLPDLRLIVSFVIGGLYSWSDEYRCRKNRGCTCADDAERSNELARQHSLSSFRLPHAASFACLGRQVGSRVYGGVTFPARQ
jgi:hypothetical protein